MLRFPWCSCALCLSPVWLDPYFGHHIFAVPSPLARNMPGPVSQGFTSDIPAENPILIPVLIGSCLQKETPSLIVGAKMRIGRRLGRVRHSELDTVTVRLQYYPDTPSLPTVIRCVSSLAWAQRRQGAGCNHASIGYCHHPAAVASTF